MIASLRGKLVEKNAGSCLVEAGGIGYELQVSKNTFAKLPPTGEETLLWTHFHVREDAQQLYGFAEKAEKEAFLILLKVKGVGPKVGLNILSGLSAGDLYQAVKKKKLEMLVAAPGVGKKLAERLLVELADKVEGLAGSQAGPGKVYAAEESPLQDQVTAALQHLGVPNSQARQAASKAREALGDGAKVQDLVKSALKYI